MAIELNQAQEDVAGIFLSYFNRAPEFQAMQYWVGAYQELVASFGDSPTAESDAFKALSASIYASGAANGEVPQGSTITNAWYVNYVYQNVLGRAPDADGATYWTTQLDNGSIDRGELVSLFIASARAQEGSRDALYVENRTTVAVEFAQWQNSNPNLLPTLQYNQADVLAGVNEDPATVDAALDKMYSSTGGGESFDLTTGIDDLVGTAGNDTFNAYYEDGKTSTLSNFDKIDGGAGTDTLNIYTDGSLNRSFPATASVKNVEIVNIHNSGAAVEPESLTKASNYQGVQELWQIGTNAQAVTELAEGTLAGFANTDTGGPAPVGLQVSAAESASSIAVELVGTKNTWMNVNGDALNRVVVTGQLGDDNGFSLSITAGKDQETVTLATEVDTEIWLGKQAGSTAEITTFDASGSTGGIELESTLTTLTNIATGSGDDEVTLTTAFGTTVKSATVSTGDGDDALIINTTGKGDIFVDMGAGDDVVMVDSINKISGTSVIEGGEGLNTFVYVNTAAITLNAHDYIVLGDVLTNFQQLSFSEQATFDASRLGGFETFFLAEGGKVSKASGDQGFVTGGDLEIQADGYEAGTPTTYAGDLTVLAAVFDADDGAVVADVSVNAKSISLIVDAFEIEEDDVGEYIEVTLLGDVQEATVTLISFYDEEGDLAGEASVVIDTTTELQGLTTLTLVGDGSATVTNGVGSALVTIDASALEADGVGLSYVSNNARAETITLSDGRDMIVLSSSTWAATDIVVNLNLVADGSALDMDETDLVTVTGTGTVTSQGTITDATSIGAATIAAIDRADAAALNEGIVFSFNGDTYLYIDSDATGDQTLSDGDTFVKFTGMIDHDLLIAALDTTV